MEGGGGEEPQSSRFSFGFKNLPLWNGLNQGLLVLWLSQNNAESAVNISNKLVVVYSGLAVY